MARRFLILCLAPALAAGQTFLVTPFANRTNVPRFDWIGESVSETLREALVAAGLPTVSRDDREEAAKALTLRATPQLTVASLAKLAEKAEADRLVYGRMEFIATPTGGNGASRGTIRFTARVFDVKEVVQTAELFESGPVEQLGQLEVDLAWKLIRWVRPSHSAPLEDFRRAHVPAKTTARENYIRGLQASGSDQQHRFLTQAIHQDPGFSQPAFVLGRTHFAKNNYREAASWLEKIPPGNVNHQEARFLLALCRYEMSDFAGSRRIFEEIAPNLPAPELWNNLGAAQARLNEPRAIESFRRALEADTNDPDYHFNVGYALWKRGQFTEAAEHFRAVLDRIREDQDAILLLGRCLKNSGPRPGDWRSEGLERLKESYEDPGQQQPAAAAPK